MTNERHEKALEAAVAAGDKIPGMSCFRNMADRDREWVSEIISKYLSEMDAVIVPKKPDAGMMFAGGNMRIYPSVYMGGPPEQAKREAARIFETMVSVAPNHFTNGE